VLTLTPRLYNEILLWGRFNRFFFVWGSFDRKWGCFGLGPFSIGAVLTSNLNATQINVSNLVSISLTACNLRHIRMPLHTYSSASALFLIGLPRAWFFQDVVLNMKRKSSVPLRSYEKMLATLATHLKKTYSVQRLWSE